MGAFMTTLDDQIREADTDVLIAALRMCEHAISGHLSMACSEDMSGGHLLASREAARTALLPYADRKIRR